MKRKWIWILFLGLVLMPAILTTSKAQSINLDYIGDLVELPEIDYLDEIDLLIYPPGNYNLSFLTSDTGKEDVKISFYTEIIPYGNNILNITHIVVKSEEINITWSFEKGVKRYYYYDSFSKKVFVVKVNYSKVEVPPNPYEQQINNLENQLISITQKYNNLNQSYQTLKHQYDSMIDDYQRIKENESNWLNQINLLKTNNSALKSENNLLKDQVHQLKSDKEYWMNEYSKMETKYKDLKKKWDDIFTRIVLPLLIGFVAGGIIVKGYSEVKKLNLPNMSKFEKFRRKGMKEVKQAKYVEPPHVQSFKEGLFASTLGQSYIEGKKEPQWQTEVDTEDEKVFKFDKTTLKFKKIKPEDSLIKDEAKYQYPVWRVYVDGEMYEDVLVKEPDDLNRAIDHYKIEIEKSLRGE